MLDPVVQGDISHVDTLLSEIRSVVEDDPALPQLAEPFPVSPVSVAMKKSSLVAKWRSPLVAR